jgi:protein-export membrane protein SecD
MAKVIFIVLIVLFFVTIGFLYSSCETEKLTPEEFFTKKGGLRLVLEVDDTSLGGDQREEVVEKMAEIIRDRVNQLGVKKPLVQREGKRRIVVQLPEVRDAERVKKLVGWKALLEFKLVRENDEVKRVFDRLDLVLRGVRVGDDDAETSESADAEVVASKEAGRDSILDELTPLLQAIRDAERPTEVYSENGPFTSYLMPSVSRRLVVDEKNMKKMKLLLATPQARSVIPAASELLWGFESKEMQDGRMGRMLYLVEKEARLTGRSIVNATAGADPYSSSDFNVSFTLDHEGASKFAQLTALNIGRQIAIVLDGMVCTAPVIQTEIPGGKGRITGFDSDEEATDLAIALKSGSLPAALTIIEERVVPPSR